MEYKALRNSFFLLAMVVTIGIAGYMVIENWNLGDSFYMTIITLTTTGYQEVNPLSPEGRLFTAGFLVLGMGIFAYAITNLMSSMFFMNFKSLRRKKMEKKISKMKLHTIVCGYGRMGKVICEKLIEAKIKFIVIEQHKDLIKELEKTDLFWIEGNAANDEILEKAKIETAKVLISTVDNDADGLYLALAARSYNKDIFTIVRATTEMARKRIIKAGANKVVLPFVMSGRVIAESVINPNVEDFLDIASLNLKDEDQLQLFEIPIENHDCLIKKTLRTCGFKREGLIIVGIKNNEDFTFAPEADYSFKETDTLIAIGSRKSFKEINLCMS